MKKIFYLLIALTASLCSYAQTGDTDKASAPVDDANKEAAYKRSVNNVAPADLGAFRSVISNFNLSSFYKEGVNGKIELVGNIGGFTTGSIFVDQKIGKNDKEAKPIDLTGISPGTTVGIGIQRMYWKPKPIKNWKEEEKIKVEEIIEQYKDRLRKGWAKEKEECEKKKNRNNDNCCCMPEDIDTAFLNSLSIQDVYREGDDIAQKALQPYIRKAKGGGTPWFLNAKASLTKTAFTYATDSVTLGIVKEAYITPTVTFSAVKILGNPFRNTGYISLSYTFSQYYEAGDEMSFTLPWGTTGNFYNKELIFGKPEKKTTHNFGLEYRSNFYVNDNAVLAIAPAITVGVNTHKLSVQIPLYFIPGKDEKGGWLNNLQGGVRLGYITATDTQWASFADGFTAQLVISEPISVLFPK